MKALGGVLLIVAMMVGLPAAAPAGADTQPVTVAVHSLPPFVSIHDNLHSGFTIDIWEEIAKREQLTTNYLDVNGLPDQLKALDDHQADVAAGAISITADRMKIYDFSQPTLNGGLQILLSADSVKTSQPGLGGFMDLLFSKTMLVWLIAGLALTLLPAHIIWLVERRHPESIVSRKYFPGIFQSFDWGFAMLGQQPADFPRHWVARALATLWAFVSIVFVAYYTATLTSNLTVAKITNAISSPSDLVGHKVCTVADTTSARYLQTAGIEATGAAAVDDCYKSLKKGDVDAVVFDAPVLQYYVNNDGAGSAILAGTIFEPVDYGLAFRNGDPLLKRVDEALLAMREDGTYDLIKKKWFGDPDAVKSGS